MEVFYFYRRSNLSSEYFYADCFFIKSEDFVLVREDIPIMEADGDRSKSKSYGIKNSENDTHGILKEARSLEEGNNPYPSYVTSIEFSKMKRFELNKVQLRKILKDVRERDSLQERVKSGIEALIELSK